MSTSPETEIEIPHLSWGVGTARLFGEKSISLSDPQTTRATVALLIPGQLGNNADEAVGMKSAVKAERNRAIVYWLTTAILAVELLMGGAWDLLMLPQVREVIHRVGYPVYFLVILGVWKLLGSIAIIIPRFPRLKEWAYAGVIFNLTGALASNLVSGVHDATTVVYLVGMMGITFVSWALRPSSRRTFAVS
jgi:uncharacterized membrane protein YphA (DoxX/SURF4 family)